MWTIGIIIALIIIGYLKHKNIVNPVSVMAGIWFLAVSIYCSGILEYNRISNLTYWVISLGIGAFAIGALFFKRVQLKYSKTEYTVNASAIIGLEILAVAIMLPDVVNSIKLLLGGFSFETIRTNATVGASVITNPIISLVRNYIINPFIILVYPLSAYVMVSEVDRTEKWSIVGLAVVICLCQVFYQGGRSCMVYFLMHILIVPRMMGHQLHLSRKIKRLIICAIAVVFVIFYAVSLSRGVNELKRSLLLYVSGCIPLMDHYLQTLVNTQFYTYGGAFFEGVLRLVFTLAENIGLPYPQFVQFIEQATNLEITVSVGNDIRMNAFVSCFYYFYLDGGLIMLFFDSFLYGAISEIYYKKALYSSNPKYVVIYALFLQSLVFSIVRFQFVLPSYILAVILAVIFFKKKNSSQMRE